MQGKLKARFNELLSHGAELLSPSRTISRYGQEFTDPYIREEEIVIAQKFFASSLNVLSYAAGKTHSFYSLCHDIITKEHTNIPGIKIDDVAKVLGIVQAAYHEFLNGMLCEPEYYFSAVNLDNFLTHSEELFTKKMHNEAGVLSAIVFEDTLKKIAAKNGLPSEKTADPLIDDLVKAGILNQPKAKILKGYATTRNYSLHANWNKLTPEDVGELIKGTRSLLAEYL